MLTRCITKPLFHSQVFKWFWPPSTAERGAGGLTSRTCFQWPLTIYAGFSQKPLPNKLRAAYASTNNRETGRKIAYRNAHNNVENKCTILAQCLIQYPPASTYHVKLTPYHCPVIIVLEVSQSPQCPHCDPRNNWRKRKFDLLLKFFTFGRAEDPSHKVTVPHFWNCDRGSLIALRYKGKVLRHESGVSVSLPTKGFDKKKITLSVWVVFGGQLFDLVLSFKRL